MEQQVGEEAVQLDQKAGGEGEPQGGQDRGGAEKLCHGDQRGETVIWLLSANISPLSI